MREKTVLKIATIIDVAEKVGVSIKTVSRVLNKEPNVRPITHDRVTSAINQLKYRPSTSARGLAGNRSCLLGLLYDNPSASYITNIQSGVLTACRDEAYDLLIHPCSIEKSSLNEEISDFVAHSRVDGLILTPPNSDLASTRSMMSKRDIPYVVISPASLDTTPWSVSTNDRVVCAEMVTHLASLHHRRIAFILGHPEHLAIANRYEGYLEGIQQCGLKAEKALQTQGYNSFESGVECAQKLLNRIRPPTAIFASNDDMAAGVLRKAHEMGFSLPNDLSVAGFDDIPLARQVWPPLTNIRQPIQVMADAATRLLIRKLMDQIPDGMERNFDSSLVIRASTGKAPGN